MGVDYCSCDGCSFGYRDDSEYICHCDCGSAFCSFSCGKLENYFDPYNPEQQKKGELIDEDDPRWEVWENEGNFSIDKSKPITCVNCRKEVENDSILLAALLEHYNLTRDQAVQIWKKQK